MRLRLLAPFVLLAACRERPSSQVDSSAAADSARAGAPASSLASPTEKWLAAADSVLRLQLDAMLVGAPAVPKSFFADWHECDYSGDDNPRSFVGVARARPIAHDTVERGSDDNLKPYTAVGYRVEVTSVVRLTYVPGMDESVPDSVRQNSDRYAAVALPHVDTLQLTVMDYGTSGARWAVCNLYGPVADSDTPWLEFIKQPEPAIRIVRWSPPNGSWAHVLGLADSIRKSSR